jgi:hypothetical protein
MKQAHLLTAGAGEGGGGEQACRFRPPLWLALYTSAPCHGKLSLPLFTHEEPRGSGLNGTLSDICLLFPMNIGNNDSVILVHPSRFLHHEGMTLWLFGQCLLEYTALS